MLPVRAIKRESNSNSKMMAVLLSGPKRRMPYIGVGTFLACAAVLLIGRRVERTLEILNWRLVAVILSGFLVLALFWCLRTRGSRGPLDVAGSICREAGSTWCRRRGLLPARRARGVLGAGGVTNLSLGNWRPLCAGVRGRGVLGRRCFLN